MLHRLQCILLIFCAHYLPNRFPEIYWIKWSTSWGLPQGNLRSYIFNCQIYARNCNEMKLQRTCAAGIVPALSKKIYRRDWQEKTFSHRSNFNYILANVPNDWISSMVQKGNFEQHSHNFKEHCSWSLKHN